MRRTRSNSIADDTLAGKRLLRSAHIEEFCEIPTKFRNRFPQPVPEQKILEKCTPTRRSSRLSGEECEMREIIRSRKRRLQSCPIDAAINGSPKTKHDSKEEVDMKACKILKKEGDCSDSPKCGFAVVKNGESETMKKSIVNNLFSTLEEEPRQLSKRQNSSPRKTRFSPRSLRSSQGEHSANCISSNSTDLSENSLISKHSNGDVNFTDEDNMQKSNSTINNSVSECHCEAESLYSKSDSDISSCKFCGKSKTFWTRKNGSLSNGEDLSPHRSRSTTQATTVSSFSTLKCAGSPMAAEEAASNDEAKSCVDDVSGALRRRVKKFEKEIQHKNGEESALAVQNDSSTQKSDENNIPEIDSSQCLSEEIRPNDKNENTAEAESQQDIRNLTTQMKNYQNEANDNENTVTDTQSDYGIQDFKRSGSPSVFDELSSVNFDFISDNESDYSLFNRKKRKMNLRSSGVRCDPDFYTLSLDLMIKRPHRRSNLLSDLNTDKVTDCDKDTEMAKNAEEYGDNVLEHEVKDSAVEATTSEPNKENVSENDEIQSLFTIKSDLQAEKIRKTLCTESESPRSLSPCSSSTPRRGGLIHKTSSRGRGRGPRGLVHTKLERSPNVKMVVNDPTQPPPIFTEEPPSGPDVYFFESDHVALKHNKDYHDLLRTVSILESQRQQCLNDIKSLENKKSEAKEEPVAFVEKLQKQVDIEFPSQQNVPDLPDIEWSKYASVYGTFDHVFSKKVLASPKKPFTRKKKINFRTGVPMQLTNESAIKNKLKNNQNNRSETFRVAWTVEEQRKLEELLLKYPCEHIEYNRYRKIAEEMGSRTALQVQSRVQKYFIKLAKAGLPIPGHMPRIDKSVAAGTSRIKRARSHPHQRLTKMSTFFPTFHVPVRMTDDDNSNANSDDNDGWTINDDQVSDEEDISEEMRFSDEYLEILRLKRLRRERLRLFDQNGQQALAQHVGYECDMCCTDPIKGVRYHCIDCPTEECIDLCQSCIRWQGQFEKGSHTTNHRMEPVYKAENFVDDDYLKFVSRTGEYNYLDPNFFPPKT